jgi:superfamily II DNA/RNA helicase
MSTTFLELGVSRGLADSLTARGITEPFPIQVAALPLALAGRDVCGRAPTGSGKTIAFGIPLVARVGRGRPRRPRALVLVPTRELASQVAGELIQLAGPKGPSVATFYGGVGYGPQIGALRRGVDVIVACPGRLTDLAERGEVNLADVEIVVVDEADRMADMGFMPQVKRLLDQVGPKRQTMLFSATLDGDAAELTRRYQHDAVRVEAEPIAEAPENRHIFWWADGSERTNLTTEVVKAHWPAIVFCRTKRGADRLAQKLQLGGVEAAAMHGDRSQAQRERALAAFISGRVQALVATDIAARGIHVDDVACVVNFDPPEDEKAYVHRSGRTGRAGASGLVVSLISSSQASDTKKLQAKLRLPRSIDRPAMASIGDVPAADMVRARLAAATIAARTKAASYASSRPPVRLSRDRDTSGRSRGASPRWGTTVAAGQRSGGGRPASPRQPRRAS